MLIKKYSILFQATFCENCEFLPKFVKFARFCHSNFEGMYFFSFYPFFVLFMGVESKHNIFYPHKNFTKSVKKGTIHILVKKRSKYQNFNFSQKMPNFAPILPFVLFTYKCGFFINSGYLMLKKILESTIPFF